MAPSKRKRRKRVSLVGRIGMSARQAKPTGAGFHTSKKYTRKRKHADHCTSPEEATH